MQNLNRDHRVFPQVAAQVHVGEAAATNQLRDAVHAIEGGPDHRYAPSFARVISTARHVRRLERSGATAAVSLVTARVAYGRGKCEGCGSRAVAQWWQNRLSTPSPKSRP